MFPDLFIVKTHVKLLKQERSPYPSFQIVMIER